MKDKLQVLLQELHDELAKADELDQSSRQQLAKVVGEIEHALSDENDDTLPEHGPGQLEEAAVEFESEYPSVAGVLRSIADTLVKIGI